MTSDPPDEDATRASESRVVRGLVLANVGLGFIALLVVLGEVGPGVDAPAGRSASITALLVATVALTVLPFAFVADPREHFRRRRLDVAIAVVCVIDLLLADALIPAVAAAGSLLTPGQITLVAVFLRQSLVLMGLGAHALRLSRRFSVLELAPGWILVGSFFALIGLGSLLLQHPAATHQPISWSDAIFTATSAVTVTGLVVVDTGSVFTPLGQGIVLVLLQIGGLGVMTLTYFVVVIVGGDLTARDRMMIREILSERRVAEVAVVLQRVVWMTLVLELVGAVVISAAMAGPEGGGRVWFPALFHSVSAFCNAGFSVYDQGIADPAMASGPGAPIVQFTMMTLIVLGGLGFPVLRELNRWLWAWRGRAVGWAKGVPALTVHTRLVLRTTAVLVVGGALVVYVTEFFVGDGAWSVSPGVTALFSSVTARTAGFSTTDTGAIAPATAMALILLMLIGGSPASTAGGIRTTTFAVMAANIWRAIRGRERIVILSTPMPDRVASRAFAVVGAAALWVGLATFGLVLAEPELPMLDLLFEEVSAFSTVGLSRGVTHELGPTARAIVVLTMFAGRVGILVFLSTVLPFRTPPGLQADDDASVIV